MLVWLVSQDFIKRLIADELKISRVYDADKFLAEIPVNSACISMINYIMYVHQILTRVGSLYKTFLEANHHVLLEESSTVSVKLQESFEVIK